MADGKLCKEIDIFVFVIVWGINFFSLIPFFKVECHRVPGQIVQLIFKQQEEHNQE